MPALEGRNQVRYRRQKRKENTVDPRTMRAESGFAHMKRKYSWVVFPLHSTFKAHGLESQHVPENGRARPGHCPVLQREFNQGKVKWHAAVTPPGGVSPLLPPTSARLRSHAGQAGASFQDCPLMAL